MANSNPSFILQEMEIVLGIPKQDPTFFNLDFLTYTGIVPDTWDVAGDPQRSQQVAQIGFQNDVSLVAEPQQTVFTEILGDKGMDDIEIPNVALRFVDIMKNVSFTGLNLTFRGYVAFPNSPMAAHDYFFKNLLTPGAWQGVGTAPIRAGLDLVYTFDDRKMNFTVQEAAIRRLDDSTVAALFFNGAFESNYATKSSASAADVRQGIERWQGDLKQFIDVVSRFFRSANQSGAPAPTPTTIPLN
ncbi:MAG: hypothetical protein AAGB01_02065 [Cyanobacteria bacterium P01_F01_bin.42]